MIAFVVGFCIINLSLWAVLLIKFKKIFSTDSIIEKSRDAMNKMVADLNRNAETDINLSKEATKRMKQMLNEAERTMENFREATDRLRDMIAEADKLTSQNSGPVVNVSLKKFADSTDQIFDNVTPKTRYSNEFIDPSHNMFASYVTEDDEPVDPNAAYEINIGERKSNISKTSLLKDETIVTPQGAAYKEVPVISAKLYEEANIGSSKIPLNEKVQKLFNKGLTAQEIAAKLSCSITEVQLVIDML